MAAKGMAAQDMPARGVSVTRVRALAVLVALLVALVAAGALAPAAHAADGDRIRHFQVDYTLQPDGTLKGRDTIDYSFAPTGETRRGIYAWWTVRRDLPENPGHYRLYDFEVDDVSSPTGAPARYESQASGGQYGVRIGDPDRSVRGDQTYVIDYTVRGTVNGIEPTGEQGSAATRTQELYVNPIGFDWEADIEGVTVTVTAPQASTRQRCFVGPPRSEDESRCRISRSGDTVTLTTGALQRGEGVTVVAEFPNGTVSNDTPIVMEGDARGGPSIQELLPAWLQGGLTAAGYGVGGLAAVGAGVGMTLAHRRKGRDEQYAGLTPGVMPLPGDEETVTRGRALPVAVRFEPPENTKPGLVGTLIDEQANTVDVSATLIDLAVRGYLRIEETTKGGLLKKDDWKLIRTDPGPGSAPLLPYEQKLYDGVFRKRSEVKLSGLKTHFATTLASVQKGMYRQVVQEGWFKKSPEQTRNSWAVLGMVIAALGAAMLMAPFFLVTSYSGASGLGIGLAAAAAGVLVAGLIVMFFASRMPARTAKGSAMLAQAKGFEQYLRTAEANQIKFEEAQNIFSRYLPYAIIFGVSERWAKVFDDVQALAGEAGYALDMPTWYVFHNTNMAWNYLILAESLDGFATTAAGTFTAPAAASAGTPGSSGGSGFSMGGGFSGGGGFGGGGGGSW